MILKKRGLSPVIATTLLISITLVLAVIIFFWARSFIGETIEKEGRAIENSCADVDFLAEAHDGKLFVQNIGSVAIYAVQMKIKGRGEVSVGQTTGSVGPGESASFDITSASAGDTIVAVPILLGETASKRISHVCDPNTYYVETTYTSG